MSDIEDILRRTKEDKVDFVQLWFTDIHGAHKSVDILRDKLNESLSKGTWFDGSSIEGFTRIKESDMFLRPDTGTYAVLPWSPKDERTARLICDVYSPDGNPFVGDPRYILKRALGKAREKGFKYNVGPELEFFLFKKNGNLEPVLHDDAGYFDAAPSDLAIGVRNEIVKAIGALGLEVEMSHHEVAPGQHEIDFKYGYALTQADRAITFKHAVKSIADKRGLIASFMPKPVFGENGSGMHVHQSLFDADGEKNLFYDAKGEYKLSDTARAFIAGQLEHISEISLVTAPKVNSYKRLVPGFEAPVYICWAQKNRSALIRIPHYSPGREKSTRAELRCPDPSCNPYLAFAVMLGAGMDGIERKLEPPKPVEEDVYEFNEKQLAEHGIGTLPESLGEAIHHFKNSKLARDVLGEYTFEKYLEAKREEYDEYRLQVTPWEIKKYLESS
ncbi:glutamine synthetase [Candidatus Pacearchaeota archaeon]|nr:glutamine synthetase [Candidatus Pacearchaeota archaeon]